MVTSKDAAEAIQRFNGDTYEGRLITVSYAKSRQSSGMFSEVQEHVLKTETS
jgi:RNA recognition motif-containing protein